MISGLSNLMLAFAAVTSLSTTGFVVVAVMWLRRLRETMSNALTEAANQQVRTAQRMADSLAQVQKQQKNYEQQIQMLAQANAQLRQGLVNVATRLDNTTIDPNRNDHTLH
jgi:DNA anti-recombination protein RmuC